MERLLNEVHYAFRSLRKAVGFSLVAIVTLAVGIGAVTTLFTVVNGVLLKPLRYPDADRIVSVVNRILGSQRPDQTGWRFCRNASMPSAASSSSMLHAIVSLATS